jgi:hypothetical protein
MPRARLDVLQAVRVHQAPPMQTELDGQSSDDLKLRVAHHGDRDIRICGGRRSTGVVYHVQDATRPGTSIEEDREQIVEA